MHLTNAPRRSRPGCPTWQYLGRRPRFPSLGLPVRLKSPTIVEPVSSGPSGGVEAKLGSRTSRAVEMVVAGWVVGFSGWRRLDVAGISYRPPSPTCVTLATGEACSPLCDERREKTNGFRTLVRHQRIPSFFSVSPPGRTVLTLRSASRGSGSENTCNDTPTIWPESSVALPPPASRIQFNLKLFAC